MQMVAAFTKLLPYVGGRGPAKDAHSMGKS